MGTVVDIVYPFGQIPKDCQPSVVTVQCDRYNGPPIQASTLTFVRYQ